ncbi:MAG: PIN domain-containing protein, partial [Pseudomonadota bacterium]
MNRPKYLLPVGLVDATKERVLSAARVKAQYPVSYADAFVVATAIEFTATIITGDPEFK